MLHWIEYCTLQNEILITTETMYTSVCEIKAILSWQIVEVKFHITSNWSASIKL